jgi:Protein of unknown function (DUF4232)
LAYPGAVTGFAVGKRAAVAAAASALLVLAPATNAPAAGTRVPTCSPSQLAVLFVSSSAGADSVDAEYGFRNHSGRTCALRGFPRVQMLTGSGGALSTTETQAPGAYGIRTRLVTLAPAKVAYFGVHYPAATGYGTLHCPTSAAIRLTAPGGSAGVVLHGRGARIQPYGGSIPHLHCGTVHVSAVSATRFQ